MVPGAGPASEKVQVHRQTGGKLYTVKFAPSRGGLILGLQLLHAGMASLYRAIRGVEM